MKKFILGCVLFIGGLLSFLIFPITSTQGPWTISGDTLSASMFFFVLILIFGFTICIYEAYIRK